MGTAGTKWELNVMAQNHSYRGWKKEIIRKQDMAGRKKNYERQYI